MNKAITIIAGALLSIFILTSCVSLYAYNTNFYLKEFSKYDVYKDLDISQETTDKAAGAISNYISGREKSMDVTIDGTRIFNERELMHMADVRKLFMWLNILGWTSAILLLGLLYPSLKRKLIHKIVKASVTLSIIAGALLAGMTFIDFEKYFIKFHEALFNNDLWLLNPATDRLIVMLPEGFFSDITLHIAGTYIAVCMILIIMSSLVERGGKRA